MKIRMLKTTKGSNDGIKVILLEAGQEYVVWDGLAENLIKGKLAVLVSPPVEDHGTKERPDLEDVVRGVVEDVRMEPEETSDVDPDEPPSRTMRKSKRTR